MHWLGRKQYIALYRAFNAQGIQQKRKRAKIAKTEKIGAVKERHFNAMICLFLNFRAILTDKRDGIPAIQGPNQASCNFAKFRNKEAQIQKEKSGPDKEHIFVKILDRKFNFDCL